MPTPLKTPCLFIDSASFFMPCFVCSLSRPSVSQTCGSNSIFSFSISSLSSFDAVVIFSPFFVVIVTASVLSLVAFGSCAPSFALSLRVSILLLLSPHLVFSLLVMLSLVAVIMALAVLVVEPLAVMLPLVMLQLCSVVWAPLVVNPLLDSATVVAVALESACSLLVVQPLSVQLHGLLPLGLQVEALLVVLFVSVLGLSKGMH